MEHRAAHAPLFQEPVEKAARRTPQEIDRDGHARASDAVHVDEPFEGLPVGGTDLFIDPEPQPAGLIRAEVVNATVGEQGVRPLRNVPGGLRQRRSAPGGRELDPVPAVGIVTGSDIERPVQTPAQDLERNHRRGQRRGRHRHPGAHRRAHGRRGLGELAPEKPGVMGN